MGSGGLVNVDLPGRGRRAVGYGLGDGRGSGVWRSGVGLSVTAVTATGNHQTITPRLWLITGALGPKRPRRDW